MAALSFEELRIKTLRTKSQARLDVKMAVNEGLNKGERLALLKAYSQEKIQVDDMENELEQRMTGGELPL